LALALQPSKPQVTSSNPVRPELQMARTRPRHSRSPASQAGATQRALLVPFGSQSASVAQTSTSSKLVR
jgi:hypothetical protein